MPFRMVNSSGRHGVFWFISANEVWWWDRFNGGGTPHTFQVGNTALSAVTIRGAQRSSAYEFFTDIGRWPQDVLAGLTSGRES